MVQKVSVIVPVYNAESTIGKCLDSIEGQDYSNLEIILINDGSKDKSEDVCKKYCEKYKNIVYIYQDNQGVSSARNYCQELKREHHRVKGTAILLAISRYLFLNR